MQPMSLAGILLIVLGTLVLAYQGINYTRQKKFLIWDRCIPPKKLTSGFRCLRYLADKRWLEESFCCSWEQRTIHSAE